ncbi:kelch-like protein 12 [Haliotis rufescens]|uniref:kelch-like protein 12 n=1 Tax=Haliotis rufescens TaxID=6454 RepID=UPI001EB01895|nr:kelch-like protein 12 [Haliotis rufescens]
MIESRSCCVPTHAKNAFDVMQDLRRQQQLCDVILCVDGAKFHAHKVVLAGCSPYLRAMFTNGMLETDSDCVQIHGVEPTTMEMLLDFMYTSNIEINVENVQSILQGASLLGLHSLRTICSHFLQTQLVASNCLGIQHFADMYTCTELEAIARQFIYQNFLEVVRTEEFFDLAEERLLQLLKSDKLQVMTESQVFEAASAWLQWDPVCRLDKACTVLQNIRLALLELPYLENVVLKSEFFRTCPKCQLFISKAIRTKQDLTAMQLVTPRAQPPCIYVVGGRNSSDCQLKSVERYDFLTDQWMSMPSMNIARTAVGATSLEGMLFAVGGECALVDTQEDTLYLRCVECYDPVMKQWIPKTEMKVARSFVAVAAVAGVLYAIGGEDRSCSYSIMERYDPKTEMWCFAPSMKRKRAGSGVSVCDGKIYVAGGYDKTLHMDRASVECFDPDTQEWTFVAEMEKARSGLSLVTVDHFIYAFGGRFRHTDQYFDLVERFNTLTRQWTTITPMNTPRAWPGISVFDGKIYVVGGFDGQSRLRSAEVYDPDADQWSLLSNMLVSRAGCGAGVV